MTEQRLAELEARLRRIEDERAIERMIASYGPLVDAGEADAVAAMWAPDGVYDVENWLMTGPADVAATSTTTATVIKAAVAELTPNSAVVLVFVRQKTASKEKPEPVVTSTSLRVTLKKVNSSWLIEKFEGM